MTAPASAPNVFLPQELLETLAAISLTDVVLYTPVFSPAHEVMDFAFAYLNPAARQMLQLPAEVAHTHRQHFWTRSATGPPRFTAKRFCPVSRGITS